MRRTALLVLTAILCLLSIIAFADGLTIVSVPDTLRPGKTARIMVSVPEEGAYSLTLIDGQGAPVGTIASQKQAAAAGQYPVYWDGTLSGQSVPAGSYVLALTMGEETTTTPILIGSISPQIGSVLPTDNTVGRGEWSVTVSVNQAGTVLLFCDDIQVASAQTAGEDVTIFWNNEQGYSVGAHTLTLQMEDESGYLSAAVQMDITIQKPPVTDTELYPSYNSLYTSDELSYWTLPFNIEDEAAVWEVLMQPMTVVRGTNSKTQTYVYEGKSTDSAKIADVTCLSQGLRVVEEDTGDGWTRVEGYSSSFHDSIVENYGGYFSGYIQSNKLITKQPYRGLGIVIDKLTQRLYVFKDGKLFTTLLCATGLPNERQPYNETTSGEFFMISKVGDFASDNMMCSYGMRFNAGDMMHEVPHLVNLDGTKNYASFQDLLGRRASHGCVRIQKQKSPEGVNALWLWKNVMVYTKVLVWEDIDRVLPYPEDDMLLYYNPKGGTMYHSDPYCANVKDDLLPLTPFTYGELEDAPYDGLTRCNACGPEWRWYIIDEINEQNAEVRQFK